MMHGQAQTGFTIWLTGLPAAGKSSVASELQHLLAEQGVPVIVLDSDELRSVLTPQPSYTEQERDWLYGVLAGLAALLTRQALNVVIAATAHRQAYRDQARAQITRFAEVEVRCSLEVCRMRDPKGIYARAEQAQANRVPGLGVVYEPPRQPEAVICTDRLSPVEAARSVLIQVHQVLQIPFC